MRISCYSYAMTTRRHGNRYLEPDDLAQYPDPMSEADFAKFLGVSVSHARRHRTQGAPPNKGEGWPSFHRRKAPGGFTMAVWYRHSSIKSWMFRLPESKVVAS